MAAKLTVSRKLGNKKAADAASKSGAQNAVDKAITAGRKVAKKLKVTYHKGVEDVEVPAKGKQVADLREAAGIEKLKHDMNVADVLKLKGVTLKHWKVIGKNRLFPKYGDRNSRMTRIGELVDQGIITEEPKTIPAYAEMLGHLCDSGHAMAHVSKDHTVPGKGPTQSRNYYRTTPAAALEVVIALAKAALPEGEELTVEHILNTGYYPKPAAVAKLVEEKAKVVAVK